MAADKLLDVEIITPQKVIFTGKAVSVTVPGKLSPFQVLYNHAPIVSSLETGIIKLNDESDKEIYFATSPGFAEVRSNHVSVLVDAADEASAINLETVKADISGLKAKLKEAQSQEDKEILKSQIKVAENKKKCSEKYGTK